MALVTGNRVAEGSNKYMILGYHILIVLDMVHNIAYLNDFVALNKIYTTE